MYVQLCGGECSCGGLYTLCKCLGVCTCILVYEFCICVHLYMLMQVFVCINFQPS